MYFEVEWVKWQIDNCLLTQDKLFFLIIILYIILITIWNVINKKGIN